MPTAVIVRDERPGAEGGKGARRRRACGSFSLATYNIREGWNEGLYSAARALEKANVDIAFVQETKILSADFATKRWAGYDIRAAAAGSPSCGGVALLVRDSKWVRVENDKVLGNNVISFEMVLNEEERFFAIG